MSTEPTVAEESVNLTPGVVWTDSQLSVVRSLLVEVHSARSAVAAAREEGRREGERRVAGWALLLADEFEALARTSDLIADDFAAKADPVTEQWHRGLAQARRTSADRLRAAVAPAQPAEGGR